MRDHTTDCDAWRASRGRTPGRSNPECAQRMRAAGSWRNRRSIASGIGVGMQHETMLPGERDHRAAPPADRHRLRTSGIRRWRHSAGGRADPRETRLTDSSRTHVAMSPRVRYGRSDGSTRSGASATRRCVPSSPELETSARLMPCTAQDGDRLFGREVVPRVVAVMHVRVEDRQFARRRRCGGEEPQRGEGSGEGTHERLPAGKGGASVRKRRGDGIGPHRLQCWRKNGPV